ncbi:hypothetical protein NM688_g9240 [Phlebia brevispora]|uniref:Uncharacterized protein n=1 Tax=Phlebia brevispora TaxID=194682 RepID=A0ACC1RHV1_9APHY|nr:hypothetical protein NM688_g9240 [Phlebia brevispora]
MSEHVLKQLARHRALFEPGTTPPPLFVAVQGPQGSGKTYLTSRLRELLTSEPHSLSVVVLSIDDLYLRHEELVALAKAHPENRLLHGRGQPGTHDVQLGADILTALQHINEDGVGKSVEIPSFDKSLFGGEGDRVEHGTVVKGPVDVVALEGWCVGFYPSTQEEIARRWQLPVPGLGEDFFGSRGFRQEDVLDVNERLKAYVEWWKFFDVFIQIKPVESHPYDYIYVWRLQQEHHMKSLNGGKGMTDDQVSKFVDRYIPGYIFFGDGIVKGGEDESARSIRPPWLGNGLSIQIGEKRDVLKVDSF